MTTDLTAAIEATLRSILDQGVSPASLARIERFARAQREALIAVQGPETALDNRLASIGALGLAPSLGTDADLPVALAPAPPSETYGANALRSIVGPLSDALARLGKPPPPRDESVVSLVAAIKLAEQGGLTDVAKDIRDKLREHMATPTVAEEWHENKKASLKLAIDMIDATPEEAIQDGNFGTGFVAGVARGLTGLTGPEAEETPRL